MKWERYGAGSKWAYWRAVSPRLGSVKITYSRQSKTWYLMTNPWLGEGIVLSHHATRQAAQKAAE